MQPGGFVPSGLPAKPKSKKKMIAIIVSSVIAAILLILGGLYGYSVYSKTQALESMRNDRNSLKKKTDELQSTVSKLESIDKLKKFERCVYDYTSKGADSGRAFHFTTSVNFEITEKTEDQLKEILNGCKNSTDGINLSGASERIDEEIKKLEETRKKNSQYVEEAKTALNQWNEFKASWKTGYVEEAEFNRIRGLAAKSMGVDPATLGTRLSYQDIAMASFSRMFAIEKKQETQTGVEFRNYIAESSKDVYSGDFEDAYTEKQKELEQSQKALTNKEKELKEKEAKIWNPFQ